MKARGFKPRAHESRAARALPGSRPVHRRSSCSRHLCLLILCLFPATSVAEVTSIADWTCAKWTLRRSGTGAADPPQMWLAGYLTGLSTGLRIDALAITDAEATFKWMDRFCIEHPDTLLSTAGGLYFKELLQRLPRSRAYQSRY